MGILDEAIKEHLELKRQHGAGESELQQIEDEAFGAAERPGGEGSSPDPLAEAPTEFMAQPDLGGGETGAVQAETPTRRRTEIADLQEPPPESPAEAEEASAGAEGSPEEAAPPDEEPPPAEHEAVSVPEPAEPEPEAPELQTEQPKPQAEEPEPPAGPSTEERQAIAEQPTEMYDVEEELAGAEPEVHATSEEDEEFWDEKRLSDELDQALEAPLDQQAGDEPEAEEDALAESEPEVEAERHEPAPAEEDVLEETPDFLEEAPEDDRLWFEQKPPKDFDFDD